MNRRIRWIMFCYPIFFSIWLAWCFCVGPAYAQAHPENALKGKNVLILNAFESNMPAFEKTNRGISAALQSGGIGIRNQFYENLDLVRNPGPENRRFLMELLRSRYGRRKIDFIITLFPESLNFLLNRDQTVFSDAPTLALFLPQGFEMPETGRRIISHLVIPDQKRTLKVALRLFPKSERVYVVSGSHLLDKWLEGKARQDFKELEGLLKFRYLSDLPLVEILTTVSSAPADTIVLTTAFSKDVSGKYQTTVEITQRLAQVSKAPIFGFLDTQLGLGIVGGSLISFEYIGTRAGQLALDMLRGSRHADNFHTELKVPQVDTFDWRQLKHWNLNENALPKGSIIINREFSLWDLKYYFIGVLVFILSQSLLIVGLLLQKRRRESAEVSLVRSEEKYRNIFESAIEGIFETSSQGQVLTANPALARMMGYDSPEEVTSSIRDTANQIWANPNERADYVRLLDEQNVIRGFECQFLRKDGSKFWVSLNARRMTCPDGPTLLYSGFLEDITERMKAEAENRQQREEIAHMARVAAMGELTSSLAHEINQPLTAIRSNAEAARRFLSWAEPDTNEVRQILDDIIRNSKRAGEVVQKVRSLLRKEETQYKLLDLNKAIQEVIDLIRGESILFGLTINLELSTDLKIVRGDRNELQQVVLNLTINSAAAMRNSQQDQRKINIRTVMLGSRTVKVSVTDTGTGIDGNDIESIFEPFYTTKHDGLGLGLSISQRIIKDHGGTMEASNNPIGGATFAFSLPAHQGEPT